MNQPIEGEQYAHLWANVIETSEAVSYEKLPQEISTPSPWQAKIQELVEKTREGNREFGVVGYFSPGKPGPQNIRFGKVTRGKEHSITHFLRERKMFVLPLGSPKLLIHTHPPISFEEQLPSGLKLFSGSPPVLSGQDLAVFLDDHNNLVLSFVIFTREGGQFTDVDVLVKCRETRLIASDEGRSRIITNYGNDLKRLSEWVKTNAKPAHLTDFKRFFATVVGTYRVGYYSSYNCGTATHQELKAEKLTLTRIQPFESLDQFVTHPGFLRTLSLDGS